jgi:arabinogalactan endo-1,4-beta-galactosidase
MEARRRRAAAREVPRRGWSRRCRLIARLAVPATLATGALCHGASTPDVFYTGGDISLATFMQQQNVVFRDDGVAKPLEQVLYDHGANLFRLRLFVNPQTTYTNTNFGAIQNLSYAVALAQQLRANAPDAKLLLDFHYSDTWADPGRQTTPAAWNGQSLSQLESTIRSYTSTALTTFKDAGVMPEMVQVGNEIQSGMLWDAGKINFSGTTAQQRASWQNFGRLVKSAIQGVRDAQGAGPAVQIAVHPGQSDVTNFFFSRLTDPTYGNVPTSSYEIMGASYYPTTDQLGAIQSDLTTLVNTHNKKVMVLETNAPWRSQFAPASDPTYADTPQGQAGFLADLRDVVLALPGGNGMGVLWWYPESVQVAGYNIYNGGSTALFDASRNALAAVNELQPSMSWAGGSGNWSEAGKWDLNLVPNTPSLHVRIDGGNVAASTVALDQDATISQLSLSAGDTLAIPHGRSLTLTGRNASMISGVVHSSGHFSAKGITVSGLTSELHYSGGTMHLSALQLTNSGKLFMSPDGNKLLQLSGLSVDQASGSQLDIADNKLLVAGGNIGTASGAIYSGLAGLIQSAHNGGAWNGPGITTRIAEAATGLTSLGIATAADAGYTGGTFGGVSVSPSDVLIMYTYAGDANLDGIISGDDYAAIDFNVAVPAASGWSNGDFNYDGILSGDDYSAIDFNIVAQGAPFPTGSTAVVAVPEPAVAAIGGFVVGLLLRRCGRTRSGRADRARDPSMRVRSSN